MSKFVEIDTDQWGYAPTDAPPPLEIAERLVREVERGIKNYDVLSIEAEPAKNNEGYKRVFSELPVSAELFDFLFNGHTGYRAQYYDELATGEAYNKVLVDQIVPLLISSEHLCVDGVDQMLCEKSLLGPYTKVWFSKEITDPSYEPMLSLLPEVIRADRWRKFWAVKPKPRKGLLAPNPENPAILLNGTFVHPSDWRVWEQKPGRSNEIHAKGWT